MHSYRDKYQIRVSNFIENHTEESIEDTLTAKDLYTAWKKHCQKKQWPRETQVFFTRAINEEIDHYKKQNTMRYPGCTLK